MESTHAATMAAYSAGVPPPSPKPKAENPAAEKPQGQWRVGLLGKDKAFLDLSADAKAAEAKRRVRVLLHHYADAKVDLLAMLDHHVTADNAELMGKLQEINASFDPMLWWLSATPALGLTTEMRTILSVTYVDGNRFKTQLMAAPSMKPLIALAKSDFKLLAM